MPPPNQHTVWPSGFLAASMRTFMCTVGAYGLRGWKTSDTPMASKGAPASSGRCWVALGGRRGPRTCEKPQPARSNTAPFSRIWVMPLPCSISPGGFSQGSTTSVPPSSATTAPVMRDCKSTRYWRTVSGDADSNTGQFSMGLWGRWRGATRGRRLEQNNGRGAGWPAALHTGKTGRDIGHVSPLVAAQIVEVGRH